MPTAIIIRTYGSSDQLVLEDVDLPTPARDEILVRQSAIGVNYHDVYVRSGLYKTLSLPGIPGCEAAGIVESVGADVLGIKPGMRIAYVTGDYGAYSSHRTLPAHLALPLPDDVSDGTAASNLLRAMTAEILTAHVHKINSGSIIIVHAAAGGVGRMLCQVAANIGATVIGTVGSPAKVKIALENGCSHVVEYRKVDVSSEVAKITHGAGVDVVFDSVGADTFAGSIESLAMCGHLINFGQSSGPVNPIAMSTLATKSLTVSRPILFHYLRDQEQYKNIGTKVLQNFKSGATITGPAMPLALKDAALAHDTLESKRGGGSLVLIP